LPTEEHRIIAEIRAPVVGLGRRRRTRHRPIARDDTFISMPPDDPHLVGSEVSHDTIDDSLENCREPLSRREAPA
jgi:hypothetical protein